MAVSPEPIEREITRTGITAWVQEYIDGGLEPNAAFSQVFEEIIRGGYLEDLARLHGVSLVSDFWLDWNRRNRPAAINTQAVRPMKPIAPMAPLAPVPTSRPRQRVVNPEVLRETSLLDGLYRVGDAWVRLGDMDKALCHRAFQQYRDSAVSDEHNARYFRAIEAVLEEGQTVQMALDDTKLMLIYKRAKPHGNMLA